MQQVLISKKYVLVLVTIVVALGVVTMFIFTKTKQEEKIQSADLTRIARSDNAPVFVRDDGTAVELESLRDTVVLVSAWASWCPQCGKQLSVLDEIARDYNGRVTVYAVNREENPSIARAYLKTLPVLESLEIVFDDDDHFFAAVEGYAMPETLVYAKDGSIVFRARDVVSYETLQQALEDALDKN